ncbi:hypothetical protein PDESU_02030 [Pontiella desulfatans]|uniref:Uncharacterized protein n=1 Tax=Pontiella desulfatans TaxID=2750659 RepID=A0A6C2U0S2_PONDE|nr:hypothetical protein [Pontiella desulfatans]VGO13473.1 hypothetical protein PDESU_02030 [Pontiella desulfatans]
MNSYEQLYFIPILDDATKQVDRRDAYRDALSSIDAMGALPGYHAGHRLFLQFIAAARPSSFPGLLLECDGELVARIANYSIGEEILISDLLPGHYRLSLSIGRVIWIQGLEARDLLWFSAFPSAPMRLAATSGDEEPVPSIEDTVMDGAITVRVFPGLHSGTISIRIAP